MSDLKANCFPIVLVSNISSIFVIYKYTSAYPLDIVYSSSIYPSKYDSFEYKLYYKVNLGYIEESKKDELNNTYKDLSCNKDNIVTIFRLQLNNIFLAYLFARLEIGPWYNMSAVVIGIYSYFNESLRDNIN